LNAPYGAVIVVTYFPAPESRFAKPSSAAASLGAGGVVETMLPLISLYHL
jgi:hypothetical protein